MCSSADVSGEHGMAFSESLKTETTGSSRILVSSYQNVGNAVAQWLRCCARNRTVAGSIPAGVIGIFHRHKILPIALWPWDRLSL